jgi:hypothetical protein
VRKWLMAQAVGKGQWRNAVRLGRDRITVSGWSHALTTLAARLGGIDPVPPNWRVWFAWVSTWHWRATWPMLQQALASPRAGSPATGPGQADAEGPAPPPADLPQALRRLVQALGAETQDQAQDTPVLAQAIAATMAWFDSASTRARIEQRAAQSSSSLRPSVDAVLLACQERLVELIVPLLECRPQLAQVLGDAAVEPGSQAACAQAVRRARDRLHADIEVQCADYLERTTAQKNFEGFVEHRTWVGVRDAADRLLALDPSSEHALFQTMFLPVCNFAAFLFNQRKQRLLAYEMFSWLHIHAGGDAEGQALLARNVTLLAG